MYNAEPCSFTLKFMSGTEIYIGSLIEYGSDRAVLERVAQLLSARNCPAVVLANLSLGGRQIDLVVALDRLTLVLEAKSCAAPVRGGENGCWQVRVASGGWKNTRNFFQQAIGAKYALRDSMSHFSGTDVDYPSAALVFCPSIPTGSSVYRGDYKAEVVGLDAVGDLLQRTKAGHWSLDQWRAFAKHHRLTRVDNAQAAFDPLLAAAEDLIGSYIVAFQRTYDSLAAELIHYTCDDQKQPCSSEQIVKQGATGTDLLLRGPSGCGKSLVAYRIGIDSIDHGSVPIFVHCKDFEGNLRDVLNTELALLDAPSADALVKACQRLGRSLLFLVDGYNECTEAQRSRLTRCIAAASRRYEASVVVTAQSSLERAELLQLREIAITEPDLDTKLAIAKQASGNGPLHTSVESLLNSVSSGIEARLLGEIGRNISSEPSRYAIFDAYVRKRLGDNAVDGIRALARVAGYLSDRISFGLTVRDLDRFSEQQDISTDLLRRLHETNLLTERGGRASFAHELFLNAFAAEAVIRRANGSVTDIIEALRSPRHAERRVLIIGAIDDQALLAAVLAEIDDAMLIEACLSRQCGVYAHTWAEGRCEEVIKRMRAEIEQIEFEIGDAAAPIIQPAEASLFPWSAQERAFLAASGVRMSEGHHLDTILEAIAAMDDRLAHEHERLFEAARTEKVALHSELFANTYTHASDRAAISVVCKPLHSGLLHRKRRDAVGALLYERLSREDLSHGQLYVLLALSRLALGEEPSIAPLLPDILRRHWAGAAYHLRLDLLLAAQFCGGAKDTERRAIIEALEGLPPPQHLFLSTALVDALQSLGALEDSETEHIDVVRSSIRELLADQNNPDMQALASGVWFSQFDHPYERAYYQAISELPAEDEKSLLIMAGQGAEQEAFFVPILILDLASYNDPAVGEIVDRWTALPPTRCVMPQNAIQIFASAHIALARLGCSLPASHATYDSNSARAVAAYGQILYWLNRCDLSIERRHSECAKPLATLLRHEFGVSAGAMNEFYRAHSLSNQGLSRLPGTEPVYSSIWEIFPAEVAEICRQCLRFPERQGGYFDHFDQPSVLEFAIATLGEWGSATDIVLLRDLSNDAGLGSRAISAIRKLELVQT